MDLPRGPERETVRERKCLYELNGRESDALATIAAFRVVQVSDVHAVLGQDGFNRTAATPSQGMIDSFWLQGMMSGHKNAYDCIKAFSETDFTDDLKKVRQANADHPRRRRPDRA